MKIMYKIFSFIENFFSKKYNLLPSLYGRGLGVGLLLGTSLGLYAQNPIAQTCFSTDPAPMVSGDRLYVFTGHDEDNDNRYGELDRSWMSFEPV